MNVRPPTRLQWEQLLSTNCRYNTGFPNKKGKYLRGPRKQKYKNLNCYLVFMLEEVFLRILIYNTLKLKISLSVKIYFFKLVDTFSTYS